MGRGSKRRGKKRNNGSEDDGNTSSRRYDEEDYLNVTDGEGKKGRRRGKLNKEKDNEDISA